RCLRSERCRGAGRSADRSSRGDVARGAGYPVRKERPQKGEWLSPWPGFACARPGGRRSGPNPGLRWSGVSEEPAGRGREAPCPNLFTLGVGLLLAVGGGGGRVVPGVPASCRRLPNAPPIALTAEGRGWPPPPHGLSRPVSRTWSHLATEPSGATF